jgi:hypothetical protein
VSFVVFVKYNDCDAVNFIEGSFIKDTIDYSIIYTFNGIDYRITVCTIRKNDKFTVVEILFDKNIPNEMIAELLSMKWEVFSQCEDAVVQLAACVWKVNDVYIVASVKKCVRLINRRK